MNNKIAVCGMHRAGTSLVARVLNLCGADLGENLLGPAPDNPAGFWENREIVALNNHLLRSVRAGWDRPPDVDSLWDRIQQGDLTDHARRAADALDAFKDPRITFTWPLWRAAFPDLKFVVCVRHPLEVAASLHRRNGVSMAYGLDLWRECVSAMVMLPSPMLVVHYSHFLEEPVAAIERLCEFAELTVSRETIKVAAASVNTKLWRNRSTIRDLQQYGDAELVETYFHLCKEADYEPKEWLPLFSTVVIVTHNSVDCLEACLRSVEANTGTNYEIVLVDNASTDGTLDMIADYVKPHGGPFARAVASKRNLGFAGGCNLGLSIAHGDAVILLNPDCVVTEGWLESLTRALQSDPRIGLAGSMSNNVSGPQVVRDPPYLAGDGTLELFARRWHNAHKGVTTPIQRLVGFCLAIRKDVIQTIGGLDPQFFPGCFEDDDYCFRAMMAGYTLVIARDSYVHHEGGHSIGRGEQFSKAMKDNWERFREKWGIEAKIGEPYKLELPVFDSQKHFVELPVAQATARRRELAFDDPKEPGRWPSVTLCMIVRDEENHLAECIASVGDLVNYIIIVDTGSVDRTLDLARDLADEVREFVWIDDFSAARNESLRDAPGEWILWMDADDRMSDKARRQCKQAVICELADAYNVKIMSTIAGEEPMTIVAYHTRLFRNNRGVRFLGTIHENPGGSVRAQGLRAAQTNIGIKHVGYTDPKRLGPKAKRNRDILLRRLEEDPDNACWHYDLGICLKVLKDIAGAIPHLEIAANRVDELRAPMDVYQAMSVLALCLGSQGRVEDAEVWVEKALERFGEMPHAQTFAGIFYLNVDKPDIAKGHFEKSLELPDTDHFMSWPRELTERHLEIARGMIEEQAR